MRTINSVSKVNTNYSKFGYFIEEILSVMDISDRGKSDPPESFFVLINFLFY